MKNIKCETLIMARNGRCIKYKDITLEITDSLIVSDNGFGKSIVIYKIEHEEKVSLELSLNSKKVTIRRYRLLSDLIPYFEITKDSVEIENMGTAFAHHVEYNILKEASNDRDFINALYEL